FVFLVPLPFSVKCTFELQPRGGQQVYPIGAGIIRKVMHKPGAQVQQGDVILKLENADLEFQLADLEGRYKAAEEEYSVLFDQRYTDPAAAGQLDVARELCEAAKRQYEEKKAEFDKLTITV